MKKKIVFALLALVASASFVEGASAHEVDITAKSTCDLTTATVTIQNTRTDLTMSYVPNVPTTAPATVPANSTVTGTISIKANQPFTFSVKATWPDGFKQDSSVDVLAPKDCKPTTTTVAPTTTTSVPATTTTVATTVPTTAPSTTTTTMVAVVPPELPRTGSALWPLTVGALLLTGVGLSFLAYGADKKKRRT